MYQKKSCVTKSKSEYAIDFELANKNSQSDKMEQFGLMECKNQQIATRGFPQKILGQNVCGFF